MADRKGKLCDDCLAQGKETVIGICSSFIMYMVVGIEQGWIEHKAILPRFGWEIYAEYNERKDALEMRAVPRAELCACCWVQRLAKKGALDLVTHDACYAETKARYEKLHPQVTSDAPTD